MNDLMTMEKRTEPVDELVAAYEEMKTYHDQLEATAIGWACDCLEIYPVSPLHETGNIFRFQVKNGRPMMRVIKCEGEFELGQGKNELSLEIMDFSWPIFFGTREEAKAFWNEFEDERDAYDQYLTQKWSRL